MDFQQMSAAGLRSSIAASMTLFLLVGAGCRVMRTTTELPGKAVNTFTPGSRASTVLDPVEFQVQLERFADDFTTRTAQALDEYAQRVGTPSARLEATQIKLTSSSGIISIASGPNPNVNLLDMVSVAALTRMVVEDYWIKTTNGPAFEPWLEASRGLEMNAWDLAGRVLKPAQIDELRQMITDWYARNPTVRSAFFARPNEFVKMMSAPEKKGGGLGSLTELVNLDPTSGLDPAVREMTHTRLFAERAMFTMQRMPFLLRWQTEFLAQQLASQPEVQLALTNTTRLSESADRISRASESVSQTAAQLPDRLSAERKEILAALEQQEGKLKDLTAQVNLALGSGEKMSSSLNTTFSTFDALMKRFGVGERGRGAPATNSPPFNILDYAHTAEKITAMAGQIDALLKNTTDTLDAPALDKRLADLKALSGQVRNDARSLLNHAFLLTAGVVVLVFICVLAYRTLASQKATAPSPVDSTGAVP
jgi:hypothetical protein